MKIFRKPTPNKDNEVVDGSPPVPQSKPQTEDSIAKIQKIQSSVLELMDSVEKFDGKSRKEYLYLDEMLTQNLLKLDTIDAEGKENIKQARREAIKCVNGLISVLEAKLEANEQAPHQSAKVESSDSAGKVSSTSQNGLSSKNSSYDNVAKASSNNSVNQNSASTTVSTSNQK